MAPLRFAPWSKRCELDSASPPREPAQVVDLPEVVVEVTQQVYQELLGGDRGAVVRLRIRPGERFGREPPDHRRDRFLQLLDSVEDLLLGDTSGAEFAGPVARLLEVTELATDVLAKVALEMERQRPRGVADAGCNHPKRLGVGEGAKLLLQSRQIATEEGGSFLGEHQTSA